MTKEIIEIIEIMNKEIKRGSGGHGGETKSKILSLFTDFVLNPWLLLIAQKEYLYWLLWNLDRFPYYGHSFLQWMGTKIFKLQKSTTKVIKCFIRLEWPHQKTSFVNHIKQFIKKIWESKESFVHHYLSTHTSLFLHQEVDFKSFREQPQHKFHYDSHKAII